MSLPSFRRYIIPLTIFPLLIFGVLLQVKKQAFQEQENLYTDMLRSIVFTKYQKADVPFKGEAFYSSPVVFVQINHRAPKSGLLERFSHYKPQVKSVPVDSQGLPLPFNVSQPKQTSGFATRYELDNLKWLSRDQVKIHAKHMELEYIPKGVIVSADESEYVFKKKGLDWHVLSRRQLYSYNATTH